MKPVIGIPLGLDDRERWKRGRQYLYLDASYARSVERAGGLPLLLPIQRDPRALVDRIDALILPGGDDFLPDTPYPEDVAFDPAPAAQVDFDRQLLDAALDRGLPFLGICYGAQLLALHLAGTLHHHLPHDYPDASPHQLPEQGGRHLVEPVAGSTLAAVIGEHATPVNSLHHQAIADPGPRLRVGARAPDGVIEAVETRNDRFTLGVQWHPERLSGPAGDGVLAALVAACGQG